MDEQSFLHVLESVLAPDNNTLQQATQKLQTEYYKNPASLPILVKVVREHPNQNLRQLAAVEARTLVPKFWGLNNSAAAKLGDDVKQQIKESLMLSASQDTVAIVRHSAARVISAIARIELPDGLWHDLPGILLQAAGSPKSDDREVATYVLYTLLDTLEEDMASRWKDFLVVFSRTINDPESMSVRLNTLLALGKMSEILNSEEHPQSIPVLRELIPPMVAVLKQVTEDGDEEKSNSAFDVFQTLLLADPAITSNHFRDLVEFFSDLSINKGLDDDNRTKALCFLLSCLRYKKLKIQSFNVGPILTQRAIDIVAEFKEIQDDDETTPPRTALQLLDFMASALPPSMVVVPLLKVLRDYTNSQDPEFRKAGILALGHCVEGAPDFIVTQLDTVFPVVLQLLGDPEARVRQAALEALMQLADDLHDELGKEHARLIPLLINMMDSADGPEIWRRACNAIDAVLVGVEQEDVETYLPVLIPKLTLMFQMDDFKLKAASVGAIGSTAMAAKKSFTPFFAEMMHGLSPYVQLKQSEEELDLRGIVIDCMGSIAEAVGMQPFTPYVQPLMQAAEESIQLGHPRMKENAFMFFGTIAKIYGEEFKPFLEGTTRALFESLSQPETDDFDEGEIAKIISVGNREVSGDIIAMDGDDDDDDDDEEVNWEEFSTVSAVAFEKEVAAETLAEILSHCKQGFLPYLEKTVEVLKEKANHHYEGVRKAAVSTLWRAYATLWQVCEEKGMAKWQPGLPLAVQPTKELVTLGNVLMKVTFENLKTETDRSTVTTVFQTIAESLKLCGPAVLADNDGTVVLELATQIVLVLTKQHPAQIDDFEEEDIPELLESSEYDWMLVDSSMDVLLGLAVALGPQFSQIWKITDKHLLRFASSSEPRERSTSVGVIADSIKFMQSGVTPYTEQLMNVLLHRIADEDQETKANAAYAMGLLCLFSEDKQRVLPQYNTILQKLERFLTRTRDDNPRLLDNAAGCIARMIAAAPDNVPLGEVLPALATVLPLTADFEENEPVYKMLVKLYQASNPTVFGMTQQFVPIFAQVLDAEDQLNDETRAELVELIKFLHSKEPGLIQNYPVLFQFV